MKGANIPLFEIRVHYYLNEEKHFQQNYVQGSYKAQKDMQQQ